MEKSLSVPSVKSVVQILSSKEEVVREWYTPSPHDWVEQAAHSAGQLYVVLDTHHCHRSRSTCRRASGPAERAGRPVPPKRFEKSGLGLISIRRRPGMAMNRRDLTRLSK
jgi:hypothetical protein